MTRTEILDTAKEYITKDRANSYGEAENNFGIISEYWSIHLGHKVTTSDVGIMMALLKIARMKSSPKHQDSYVDGVGYLALSGELETNKSIKFKSPLAYYEEVAEDEDTVI